jgi:hypothetical protein
MDIKNMDTVALEDLIEPLDELDLQLDRLRRAYNYLIEAIQLYQSEIKCGTPQFEELRDVMLNAKAIAGDKDD